MKKIIPFNVINHDFNRKKFEGYDVMPYLMRTWSEQKKSKTRSKMLPTDRAGLKKWIESWSRYQFWSRCEYEIVLQSWPSQNDDTKIDVYWQIMLNIDLITDVFAKNIGFEEQKA